MKIAVIGAGVAGLCAARHLEDAGHAPVVFDKSRGLGGRLATRRHDHGPFNHGAPTVSANDPGFRAYLTHACDLGAAAPDGAMYRGRPGMSGLVRPLAQGIEIHGGGAVTHVSADLTLSGAQGALGQFDQVICAIPVVQARQVLADLLAPNDLESVEMAPCWTLMAAFDGPSTPQNPACDRLGDPIPQPGAPGRWVAHAKLGWTQDNLEREADWVKDQLLTALQNRFGQRDTPLVSMVHRWRYARTLNPLGVPYLALAQGRVLVGGDWALGADADHAWQSGAAMAQAVIG